jgi:hypothetical protein
MVSRSAVIPNYLVLPSLAECLLLYRVRAPDPEFALCSSNATIESEAHTARYRGSSTNR